MVETRRRKLVPEMEGTVARWYARQRASAAQMAQYREEAARFAAGLPEGGHVLEVAPGPGYLSMELARLGVRVTGLDIGRTFVQMATESAARAGLDVDFRHGDAAAMPFPDASFDLVVCQAAFKNFTQPVAALDEMHRVLRPGGTAVIQDLRGDTTRADVRSAVRAMGVTGMNGPVTTWTLLWLRRRAYTPEKFRALAAASAFGTCVCADDGVGVLVRLTRPA